MDTSSIVGWSGLVLSILGIIYSAVNHKHCKILICGRRIDFALDVNSTENYAREDEEKQRKEYEEKKRKEEEKNKEEQEKKNKEEQEKKNKE
jgi:hypothetical protein